MSKKKPEFVLTNSEKKKIFSAMDEVYEAIDAKLWPAIVQIADEETSEKLKKIFADGRCEKGLQMLYDIRFATHQGEDWDPNEAKKS